MGKVLEEVTKKAKSAEDLQQQYIDTLHWWVGAMNDCIIKAVTELNKINKSGKATLDEIAKEINEL